MGRVLLRLPENLADGVGVFFEAAGGVPLRLQILKLPAGCFRLLSALLVHGEEIPVGEFPQGVEGQKLLTFPLRRLNGPLQGFHLFLQVSALVQRPVQLHILLNQRLGVGLRLPEYLQQQGLQVVFVNGKGGAGVRAVFDLPGADPFAVFPPAFVHRVPAVVGRAAVRAVELARQKVGVVADALAAFYVLTAPFQHGVSLLPQLFGDDGRDDFSGLVLKHHPLLRRKKFLLLGKQVHHLHLIAHIPALVFGIGDHAGHGGVGNPPAVVIAVAPVPEQRLDLLHAVIAGGVELEQLPHHRRLVLVDGQPPAVFHIAEDPAVAQHHVFFNGLGVAELHPAGQLAQLVLGDAGHNGQPEFGILVKGVDIVVLEKHAHSGVQQLPGILDGVQCVAGKAGDLLRDNEIEFAGAAVLHHAVEVLPLPGGGGGQALVNIAIHKLPGRISADKVLVVGDLVAQGVELFIALGGYAGIVCDPQGDLVDGFCPQ